MTGYGTQIMTNGLHVLQNGIVVKDDSVSIISTGQLESSVLLLFVNNTGVNGGYTSSVIKLDSNQVRNLNCVEVA